MNITLINGSHRQGSQSGRIAKFLAARLQALDNSVSADIIDLTGNPLPLWDDENNSHSMSPALRKVFEPYAQKLEAAEGFVVISPEWHGMVPAGLKNFFIYCADMRKTVAHKPALIVAVSASRGGAYPVEELRISSYKNSMICYIPEHLIVRNAEKMFVGDAPADKDDEFIRARADYALKILIEYAKAMKPIRASGVTVDKRFGSGM